MTKFEDQAVEQRGGRFKGELPTMREQRKEMDKYLKVPLLPVCPRAGQARPGPDHSVGRCRRAATRAGSCRRTS